MKILEVTSADIKLNDIDNAGQDFDSVFSLDVDDIVENTEENKERGFIGKAFVYDEEIFINTFTGEGYDLVVNKMKNFIDWYSGNVRLAGFDREDIKQFMFVLLLDGIRRYNPRPSNSQTDIRLSTFLYVHIKNRIISRIKEETRQSLNASYNEPMYKFICSCKTFFISNREEAMKLSCNSCGKSVDSSWKIRAEHHEPISLDALMAPTNEDDSGDKGSRIHYNGKRNNFIDFFGKMDGIEDVDRNLDFSNVLNEEDDTTRKIAELMYHNDYSITDAAKEVGLTCWAASLRLKKLKSKKHIKEFFLNK
jgi:DNA-directed RNA polymerase specialized sigma24 family protein